MYLSFKQYLKLMFIKGGDQHGFHFYFQLYQMTINRKQPYVNDLKIQ